MSLLDILASTLGNSSQQPGGQPAQSGQAALIAAALAFVNSQPGGLMGLIQRFQQHGAGDVVQSWIGTGENKPISPDTLTNVLGQDNVGALAQKNCRQKLAFFIIARLNKQLQRSLSWPLYALSHNRGREKRRCYCMMAR